MDGQWKPGQSGNPGGRPKGRSILATCRELLDSTVDLDGQALPPGRTLRDELARVLVRAALGGDTRAARDLVILLEGRPRQAAVEGGDTTVREAALARLRAIHDDGPGVTDG